MEKHKKGNLIMEENLSNMVRDGATEPTPISVNDLDFGDAEQTDETGATPVSTEGVIDMAAEAHEVVTQPPVDTIATTPLHGWFLVNSASFPNIRLQQLQSDGVDPSEDLAVTIAHPEGGEFNGQPKMRVKNLENAHKTPVLNLPATSMNIFNSGHKIVYDYNETTVVKCYGIKTGLLAIFCSKVGDKVIPYATTMLKMYDEELEVQENPNLADIPTKLAQNADIEAVQLLYKQIVKHTEDLTTNNDVVEWLLARQAEVTDINHLLQIDKVIISILQ